MSAYVFRIHAAVSCLLPCRPGYAGLHLRSNLEQILASGFSRLPVFAGQERQRILGYILVKSLVVVRTVHLLSYVAVLAAFLYVRLPACLLTHSWTLVLHDVILFKSKEFHYYGV